MMAAFEHGGADAVQALARRSEGPILEPADDPARLLVTFVLVDAQATRTVVLCAALPERCALLERLGDSDTFVATFELPRTALVGYSFVADPSDALASADPEAVVQALSAGRRDPFNPRVSADSVPEIRLTHPHSVLALPDAPPAPPHGVPTGSAEEWAVRSEVLANTRTVRVYRPVASDRYQLVLLLGGAEDWWAAEAAFDAMLAGGAEPFLGAIVGTRGFMSRHRELSGNDAFVRFAVEELLPFLSARYPLRDDGHVVAGASIGAVGAAHLALREPERFAAAAAVSGPFQATPTASPLPWKAERSDARPVLDAYERHDGPLPARVYLSAGRYETYEHMNVLGDTERLAAILARKGVEVRFDSGDTAHETLALRSYLTRGIGWLLGVQV